MHPGDDLDDRIERWMRERAAPPAPDGFTARVLARVRRERWRVERYWDLGFNIVVTSGLVLIVAGVLGLAYSSGLAVVARDVVLLFTQSVTAAADQVAPMLPAYVGGFALTLTALGLWWWAENY